MRERVACKLDIEKPYDYKNLDFPFLLLNMMSFGING